MLIGVSYYNIKLMFVPMLFVCVYIEALMLPNHGIRTVLYSYIRIECTMIRASDGKTLVSCRQIRKVKKFNLYASLDVSCMKICF